MRPRPLFAGAVLTGTALTVVVSLAPAVDYAYRAPTLHVVIATVESLVALVAAYLLVGRFRRSKRVSELLLIYALLLLSLANLLLFALPLPATDAWREHIIMWAPLIIRVTATVTLAVAAYCPAIRLRRTGAASWWMLGIAATTVVVVAGMVATLGGALPIGVEVLEPGELGGSAQVVGHPAVLALQLAGTGVFGLAALGFLRRAQEETDDLLAWLAVGCVLGAFARLNYFFAPSLYTDWVYIGDLLRLGFYAALLVGATREIHSYWHGLAEAATLEERERMARDIHDGLAQELAFVVSHSRRLAAEANAPAGVPLLAQASQRALDESRRAIAALTRPVDEPLDVALAEEVEEVASRAGAWVTLDLAPDLHTSPQAREQLLRIAREAVTNATRHGAARQLRVTLSGEDGVTLQVEDDGTGFNPAAARGPTSHGLSSMAARAAALGGTLRVDSSVDSGTVVRIMVPQAAVQGPR